MARKIILLVLLLLLTSCEQLPVQAGPLAAANVEQKIQPEQATITAALSTLAVPLYTPEAPAGAAFTPMDSAPTPAGKLPVTSGEKRAGITPAVTLRIATTAPSPEPTAAPLALPPERWKEWPVVPVVSEEMRAVYLRGLEQGANPRAFSVFGDCQSQPDVFMGVFESEAEYFTPLSPELKETVLQFSGSFNRYSPTVKDGTTEGALLWALWNDNKEKKCNHGETPVDCELRVHRPSIVFIHVGTHWEARNRRYLTLILDKILASGAVPVFVTKADNRELDERVNENMASLAAEYGVPLWNFWASVQHLPENGMEPGSDMYLSPDGLEVHRQGGLHALDAIWRAVRP